MSRGVSLCPGFQTVLRIVCPFFQGGQSENASEQEKKKAFCTLSRFILEKKRIKLSIIEFG